MDFIMDGGPCEVGVESTILDLCREDTVILRPGGAPREAIEEALGRRVIVLEKSDVRTPGQFESHYAPRAEVTLAPTEALEQRAAEYRMRGFKVEVIPQPEARGLYAALREADQRGADVIVVAVPAEKGLGLAIADRLRRAAGPRSRERANPEVDG